VTLNVEGRDLAAFVEEAKRRVGQIKLPAGMYAVFTGTAESRESARNELLLHSSLAGLGVLLKTQKRLLASGGKLRLTGVNRHLQDVFGYSGFDQLFEIEAAP
jgi:hypothetical protein